MTTFRIASWWTTIALLVCPVACLGDGEAGLPNAADSSDCGGHLCFCQGALARGGTPAHESFSQQFVADDVTLGRAPWSSLTSNLAAVDRSATAPTIEILTPLLI